MHGLMQDHPLLISAIIRHAARHHGMNEIVSRGVDGAIHRQDYATLERRARRLVRVLQGLGVQPADRVATLAWNGFRHVELYYAISGMGAVCHTVNPRLANDDIAFIMTDAKDVLLFADTTFAPAIAAAMPNCGGSVRAVVFLCDRAFMPDIALPPGIGLLCYEDLMAAADEDFGWPDFDERTAASLCYTSGTTGKPKGVLYSHRSTLLHAYAANSANVMGMRCHDRVMPIVPMFHVNAWSMAYSALMAGASLVMPGRHLDGASVATLMNTERVTFSAGVPTVWLGLLQHLRASGERLHTIRRIATGGSACPPAVIEAFDREYGVTVEHAWGMTECSPLGTYNTPATIEGESAAAALVRKTKQGRAIFGLDIRIVDDNGVVQPHDGHASGNLQMRGQWVCSAYYGNPPGSACDPEGWFTTGDVATIDADSNMEITDRSKDVIKSGGEWISSIALENLAVSHPDVAEAAVIAAAHPKWDERPLLLVVPKAGRTLVPEDVLHVYDGKVAKWWVPDAVLVVNELPHTATGKLSKLALRLKYRGYLLEQGT
jgi:acyl-CoA synthetase (AMP-forming)/AMP-acid ligase II